jgi:predicted phosphoribosyltransferase
VRLLVEGWRSVQGAEEGMRFRNRDQAATRLAYLLASYRGQHPLVLGVPRGAVPMARIIADALEGDVDVVLVRKLGAPGQPELAVGAVDETGAVVPGRLLDLPSDAYLREEIRTQREILRRRRELYTRTRPAFDPAGRVVIIVDDGIATGSSMLSAVRAVRRRQPRSVAVAVGVAPPAALASLRPDVDDLVCAHTAEDFEAVGQFYDDFSQVTDEMVVEALAGTSATAASPDSTG